MNGKNMVIIGIVVIIMLITPTLIYSDNEGIRSTDVSDPNNERAMDSSGQIEEQKRSESDKTKVSQQERKVIEYFEKTKSEILEGRKFNDQSTAVNALLTFISTLHHQDQNTLEQTWPNVKKLGPLPPELRSKLLDWFRKSVICKIQVENKSPEESELCGIYTTASFGKEMEDQVWIFAYVEGAWRFLHSTSDKDVNEWRTIAQEAEASTRSILQSEAKKAEALATKTLQQEANKIEGKWRAILVDLEQAYVFRFWRKPDGTLTGAATRHSPDDRPFNEVTFENGKLRFEEKINQAVFEGTMKEDCLTIEGKWQKPGMLTPCVLKRAEQVRPEAKGQADSEAVQPSEKQLQDRNKLVAWWKLDEADGNDVADSSGNGRAGRLFGNPQWQPASGKVGGALAFDGFRDFVEIGNEQAFDLTGSITVAAWLKVNSFDKRWQAIVTKGDTAWRLHRTAEENTLAFHCTGIVSIRGLSGHGIEGNKSVNDGKWHHAVGVYNGSTVSLYIDGVLDNSGEASGSIFTNDSPVFIGANSDVSDREWNGLLDEVCIIAGAIDANGVRALYSGEDLMTIAEQATTVAPAQASERQLQGRETKLVAWWKFENNASDSAGTNHATIHGNPTYAAGKVGQAISLNGDDYVDCGNPSSLNFGTDDWAVSAWIKTTQSGIDDANEPNRGTVFANGGDEAAGIRYALAVNEGQMGMITLTTDDDLSKLQAISTTAVNDGAWHHVVGTRNGRQLCVYVDGVLEGTNTLPAGFSLSGASQQNAYVGVITDNRDNSLYKYFVGLIDEVCVFACALDTNNVKALYSGSDPMTVAAAKPESLSGKSNMATTLILVLGLAGVVGAIILFLVKSSIR